MLHIDKKTKSSYYTYERRMNTQQNSETTKVLAIPVLKKKKNIHENIEEITDLLEDCILNLNCPITMSIAYSLNSKLFRKLISDISST
jgi:hypothetical protein